MKMKLFFSYKGAKITPALLIILYFSFVVCDLYTTYLATPDLRYEGNPFVRYFNLSWSQLIVYYSIIALLTASGFLLSIFWVNEYYSKTSIKYNTLFTDARHHKKLFLSFILIGTFYSHLINIALIIINNCLSIIYLFKIKTNLNPIINSYIENQPIFLIYIATIPMMIGYIFSWDKLKKIKKISLKRSM